MLSNERIKQRKEQKQYCGGVVVLDVRSQNFGESLESTRYLRVIQKKIIFLALAPRYLPICSHLALHLH